MSENEGIVHPNVMGILGICLDCHAPYVVMPFMANGSLHTYLRKHRIELLISEDEDLDLVQFIALHYTIGHCFITAFIYTRYLVFWQR